MKRQLLIEEPSTSIGSPIRTPIQLSTYLHAIAHEQYTTNAWQEEETPCTYHTHHHDGWSDWEITRRQLRTDQSTTIDRSDQAPGCVIVLAGELTCIQYELHEHSYVYETSRSTIEQGECIDISRQAIFQFTNDKQQPVLYVQMRANAPAIPSSYLPFSEVLDFVI
jgi:hypothetical protein